MMELRKLPIKIVYVEDDEKIRHMTASYLTEHVEAVYTARDGHEALEIFEEHAPDVVVTDIEMPGMNGIELIRKIRDNRPDIPIFVTTTFQDTMDLTEAIQHGITHYVYKQSEPSKLLQTIRDYFKFMHNGFLSMELDADGTILAISDTFAHYLEYEPDELVDQPLESLCRFVSAHEEACFSDTLRRTPSTENLQALFVRKNGSERLLGGSAQECDDGGLKTHWYPIDCLMRSHREITQQLEKECYIKSLLHLHAHISQEAIRATDPERFLQDVLDRLPGVDAHLAGCLLERPDRRHLRFAAATAQTDLEKLFPAPLDLEDSEQERHYLPCFLAAKHGQMVFIDNIAFLAASPFKKHLEKIGAKTLISIPMQHADAASSQILTLIFTRSHSFDKEELDLWQNIANTMAFGLVSIQMRLERDALIRRLDTMAHTDSLTGVLNRYRGVELIELEIVRAERYGHPFSIIFFDIDNFKTINDTFGHEMGDRVLVEVARAVGGAVRRTDTLIRWGGEEFLILLPETGLNEAVHLGHKLRECIENRDNGIPLPVTASFGITEWKSGQSLDTLISRADAKMYEAKRMGRNRIAY
ncbi:diguanylate cyclase [Hydrogenimonas sp.]